jgi:hypothetical protein
MQALKFRKDFLPRRVVFAAKVALLAVSTAKRIPFSGKSCYSLCLPITSTV